jgi:ABC-type nitrate/sulfonate/bicarbonate transport system substrate-binding protein
VISAANSFEFLPAEYGIELGVWEKRGLDVKNTYVSGGQFGQSMASGQFEVGLGGAASAAVIVGSVDAPIVAGISHDYTMMVLVTSNDSGISDVSDLEGKTIGITSVGSVTDSLVTVLRQEEGWDESELQAAPVGGFDQQMAALKSGATDAFIWTAEAGYQLEEEGEGTIVMDFGSLVPDNVFEAISAPRSAIDDEPDKVQKYLEGYFETIQYMKEHRAETVEFMMSQFKMSRYVAEHTYDLDIENLSTTGEIPEKNVEGIAEFGVETGILESAPEPDAYYDEQFVPVDITTEPASR